MGVKGGKGLIITHLKAEGYIVKVEVDRKRRIRKEEGGRWRALKGEEQMVTLGTIGDLDEGMRRGKRWGR